MQDSLEDYLKATKNSSLADPVKISKEMVVTAQLKKECDSRAMRIVEFSIEGKLRPEVFTKCLPFINQGHYQDIVEERAITKLCGYSLCGKRIPDMPKKQYFISTKSNKVYDITERKNFCSNFCYKASLHIKKQIDNSPLWLRKLEDIPEYHLLHSSEGGLPGELIEQGVVKPVEEVQFTSINAFAQASLGDINPKESDKGNNKTTSFKRSTRLKRSTMQTIKENTVEEEAQVALPPSNRKTVRRKNSLKRTIVVSLPSIEENEEKKVEEAKQPPEIDKTLLKNKLSKVLDVENVIKNALDSWVTLETCIFIHGEDPVKEMLDEKKLSDCFEKLHVEQLRIEQQLKYMEICKRLHLQEMAEEKFDNALIGGRKLEPLPDFPRLKQDTKELKLKVKAFYEGQMYEQEDKNFPVQTEQPSEEGPPAVLPPVDLTSQKLLRRKIFLTSLSKAAQQLLQGLGTSYSSVLSDLQGLVKTFNLRADNITFKPAVWNYIALVLVTLLSLKDQSLREVLEDKRSQEYVQLLVDALPDRRNFVFDLLEPVRNVDLFVERYITKDCDDV